MNRKFITLKNLYYSSKRIKSDDTSETKKLFSKILRAYFSQCILGEKKTFLLKFKGYYDVPDEDVLENFLKANGFRVKDEYLSPVDAVYEITEIHKNT